MLNKDEVLWGPGSLSLRALELASVGDLASPPHPSSSLALGGVGDGVTAPGSPQAVSGNQPPLRTLCAGDSVLSRVCSEAGPWVGVGMTEAGGCCGPLSTALPLGSPGAFAPLCPDLRKPFKLWLP